MMLRGRRALGGLLGLAGLVISTGIAEDAHAQFPWLSGPFYVVNLKTVGGKFVVAEGGGGGVVNANRDKAAEWERFVVVDLNGGELMPGDKVNIRSFNGKFVVAEGGGGGVVNANRDKAAEWERFTINKVGGTGKIGSGDKISLQASNGKFVVAEGGGGGAVNANRTAVGPWETFTLSVILRAPSDPSPLSAIKSSQPSQPPAPSGPANIPGYAYKGAPRCDVKYEPTGFLKKDTQGYVCCASSLGGKSARCGAGRREYSPDCTQFGTKATLFQPHGCYVKL